MKLKDILAISGQPGLYKFLAQSKNGIIVECLNNGNRMNASASSRVSSMGEISVYTDSGDVPLGKIFEAIYKHTGGEPAISHKSSPDQLKAFFSEVVPDFDRDRVHVSDIKKMVAWYNILLEAGMTDFSVEDEEEGSVEEAAGGEPDATDKEEDSKGGE